MRRTEEQKLERRESDKKAQKEYLLFYIANPKALQTCQQCGSSKSLKDFSSSLSFRKHCNECRRKRQKKWRTENRHLNTETSRRSGRKSATFIKLLKEGEECMKCRLKFPPHAMDYHHLMDKEWTISKLYGKSEERILKEIAKCQLICANCHREETQSNLWTVQVRGNRVMAPEITDIMAQAGDPVRGCSKCGSEKHEENFTLLKTGYRHSFCKKCLREKNREYGRRRTNRQPSKTLIVKTKSETPCADCGKLFPYWVMDCDHFGEEKTKSINRMQNLSLKRVEKELSLCDIVCVNCHRERTKIWRSQAQPCGCGFKPRSLNESYKHTVLCPFLVPPINMGDEEISALLNRVQSSRSEDLPKIKELLNVYHYAGYGRSASASYVTKDGDDVVAVTKFSPPVRKEVATSLGWNVSQVLELDRFCILPQWRIKNLASKAMSQVMNLVADDFPHVVVIVSFADSRQGHVGTIYKASNWTRCGTTANSYTYEDPSGLEVNKKRVFDQAKKAGMREGEYAKACGLKRVPIGSKDKFLYELR